LTKRANKPSAIENLKKKPKLSDGNWMNSSKGCKPKRTTIILFPWKKVNSWMTFAGFAI